MRQVLYAVAIAMANNVDNVAVMVAYGIRGRKIDWPMKAWIALITFAISTFAALLGMRTAGSLGQRVCSLIAVALLTGAGAWMVAESYLVAKRGRKPLRRRRGALWRALPGATPTRGDEPGGVDIGHATLLGVALSINNIVGGVGAGLIALNPLLVGALSALFSLAALGLGSYAAELLERHRVANRAALLGGLLLIAVAVEQAVQIRS
jgi:putative sporulation protein YtaF